MNIEAKQNMCFHRMIQLRGADLCEVKKDYIRTDTRYEREEGTGDGRRETVTIKEKTRAKIIRHSDLRVYQLAFQSAMSIFHLSKSFTAEEKFSLTDQIRRSSRSVAFWRLVNVLCNQRSA